MILRPYQQESVDAVYRHLREHDDNPCVVIPTAGGKTPVMATICKDSIGRWNGRVLILAHVKELLEQAVEKLHDAAPEMWNQVGVYSAGLKSRDTEHPVIVAGIQSVYRRACQLDKFDLIIIDEAHMLPPDGEGMYQTFLSDARTINPNVRLIGLTATPYRMTTGLICAPENLLNQVCYEISVRELIVQGYICRLKTKAGIARVDTSDLHIRGGEFVPGELEALMDDDTLVRSACGEIIEQTRDRRSTLIFTAGVKHAVHVQRILTEAGQECGFVCADTPAPERAETLRRFRERRVKYLVNVNVLTTGFDAPNVDCVAMLRPTMSPGLYYQMVGRGFRLCEGKENCLVLDFGGNILRHGPVDALRPKGKGIDGERGEAPAKECPQCHAVIHAGYALCPECGHAFPPPDKALHDREATTAGILSGQTTEIESAVQSVTYNVHVKNKAEEGDPRTMRVTYRLGWREFASEWICVEHRGFPREKALRWWRQRSNEPMPDSAEEAVSLAHAGALAPTLSITVRSTVGEYDRIIGYELGDKPAYREPGCDEMETDMADAAPCAVGDEGVPF